MVCLPASSQSGCSSHNDYAKSSKALQFGPHGYILYLIWPPLH